MKKILIRTTVSLLGVIAIVVGFGFWFFSLLDIPENLDELKSAEWQQLPYFENAVKAQRGRILAVVTSTDTMGTSGKRTGYELTELSRAWYVFRANGFDVDIASPQGGEPPVVIDDEDMGAFDYAFLNDPDAQARVASTIPVADIDPAQYAAVYFVGGKGAMWDFPDNAAIQSLVAAHDRDGKVVGAVCHGPAALVNARRDDGEPVLAGRRVSGFTNEEELFLIPDAREIFPFLLQDRLTERGATFEAGAQYLEQVSHDGNLVTGQNPWSVWRVAETMVQQLGYEPIPRRRTADEYSVAVLASYDQLGYGRARAHLESLLLQGPVAVSRTLIAVHALLAAMQWDLVKAVDLVRLTAAAKYH